MHHKYIVYIVHEFIHYKYVLSARKLSCSAPSPNNLCTYCWRSCGWRKSRCKQQHYGTRKNHNPLHTTASHKVCTSHRSTPRGEAPRVWVLLVCARCARRAAPTTDDERELNGGVANSPATSSTPSNYTTTICCVYVDGGGYSDSQFAFAAYSCVAPRCSLARPRRQPAGGSTRRWCVVM